MEKYDSDHEDLLGNCVSVGNRSVIEEVDEIIIWAVVVIYNWFWADPVKWSGIFENWWDGVSKYDFIFANGRSKRRFFFPPPLRFVFIIIINDES